MKKYISILVLIGIVGAVSMASALNLDGENKSERNTRKIAVQQCNTTFTTVRESYKSAIKKAEVDAKTAKRSAEATYKQSTKDEAARATFKSTKATVQKTLNGAKETARANLKVATTAKNACVRANKK